MERIKLSHNEKRLLRNIAAEVDYWSDGMGDEAVACCASVLERVGLVRVAWASGHVPADAALTEFGKAYVIANPRLRNPIDWKWIIGVSLTAIAAATGIIALFAACSLLK